MAKFETLEGDTIEFGNNNFIEVARKKVISDDRENIFLSVSKGFFIGEDKERKYKQSLTVPINEEVIDFIYEKLKELVKHESENSDKEDDEK